MENIDSENYAVKISFLYFFIFLPNREIMIVKRMRLRQEIVIIYSF